MIMVAVFNIKHNVPW